MASTPQHIQITIGAVHESMPEKVRPQGGWYVDIVIGGKREAANIYLSDPLSPNDQAKCRWYLEQYLQQNPYEGARCREAEKLLNAYPVKIMDQLCLRSLVETQIDPCSPGTLDISIEVVEPQNSQSTIHQLYWELLEDVELWDPRIWTITVHRSLNIAERPPQSSQNTSSGQSALYQSPLINILLVVARDTQRNAALYNDVSPFMASDILVKIKRDIERTSESARMNIEIVRPSTLQALEDHLRMADVRYGPGHFHLVHFDLHGKIGTRSGALQKAKYPFLYFAHPNNPGTKAERAHKVAAILQQYRIPFVVLNACESARASMGDDANIAKIFCSRGVQNVLAMSFKVSSSAASIYLQHFYHDLLVVGRTFSSSASRARATLRASSERGARFGLKLPLKDWFVPVVYSSELVSTSVRAELSGTLRPTASSSTVNSGRTPELENIPGLVGRDFDVLRLERSLVEGRYIYLHGPRGSGKTCFIRYLSALWIETSLVEAVIYIDMKQERVKTLGDLLDIFLNHLSEITLESDLLSLSRDVTNPAESETGRVEVILELLKRFSILVVLDNLNASHSFTMTGAFPALLKADVNSFLKTLLDSLATHPRDRPGFVVLIGCRSPEWACQQLGYDVSNSAFMLSGLEMADAIEFAQTELHARGVAPKTWSHPELDSLELIISLLQGLPAALKQLLSTVQDSSILLEQLYLWLHCSLRSHSAHMIHQVHLQELSRLVEDLPLSHQPYVAMLGLFWHEGPLLTSLVSSIASVVPDDVPPVDTTPRNALNDAFERLFVDIIVLLRDCGYLDIGHQVRIAWIHPALSIYTRLVQPETSCNSTSCPSTTRGMQPFDGKKILHIFTSSLEEVVVLRQIENTLKGISYQEMRLIYGKTLPNVLTCLNLCLLGGEWFPVDHWPLVLFSQAAALIRLVASVAECKLFAQRYELLLDCFLKGQCSNEIPPRYLLFATDIINYLIATYNCEVKTSKDKVHGLILQGLTLFEATEARYGVSAEWRVLYSKSVLCRAKTISCLGRNQPQEAREAWRQMRKLDDQLFKYESGPLSRESHERFVGQVRDLVQHLAHDEGDAGTMLSHLDASLKFSFGKACYESRKDLSSLVERMICNLEEGKSNDKDGLGDDYTNWLHKRTRNLSVMHQAAEIQGFYEVSQDERWWPENFDMGEHVRLQELPLYRLQRIERAADIGDWVEVAEQHQALLISALQEVDFEQAVAHSNALVELYSQSEVFSSQLNSARETKNRLMAIRPVFESIWSALDHPDKEEPDLKRTVFEAFRFIEESAKSEEATKLAELCRSGWDHIQQDGIHTAIMDKDRLRSTFRKLLRRAGDPVWREKIQGVCIKLLELQIRLRKGEQARNWDECLQVIDRMKTLSTGELERDFLDPVVLQKDWELYSWKRHAIPLFDGWRDAMNTNRFKEARCLLVSLEKLATMHSTYGTKDEELRELHQAVERLEWNHGWRKCLEMFEARNYESLLTHAKKVRGMCEDGCFGHLDHQNLLRRAQNLELEVQYLIALEKQDWDQAISVCEGWLRMNEEQICANPRAGDMMVDHREFCEIARYNKNVQRLDERCEFKRAITQFQTLERIYQEQQRTPEVRRNTAVVLKREMLDDMRRQMEMKADMEDKLGFEASRQVVLAIRQVIGYRPEWKSLEELQNDAMRKLCPHLLQ